MAPPPFIKILTVHAAVAATRPSTTNLVPGAGASDLVPVAIESTVSENNVVYIIEPLEVDKQTL